MRAWRTGINMINIWKKDGKNERNKILIKEKNDEWKIEVNNKWIKEILKKVNINERLKKLWTKISTEGNKRWMKKEMILQD